jgi:hypothetical protein
VNRGSDLGSRKGDGLYQAQHMFIIERLKTQFFYDSSIKEFEDRFNKTERKGVQERAPEMISRRPWPALRLSSSKRECARILSGAGAVMLGLPLNLGCERLRLFPFGCGAANRLPHLNSRCWLFCHGHNALRGNQCRSFRRMREPAGCAGSLVITWRCFC